METCNVGIIGLGGFARLISVALKESKQVRVIAGADTDPHRIEKFKEETGIEKAHCNAVELLPDPEIDLVIIATPPVYHYDLGDFPFHRVNTSFLKNREHLHRTVCQNLLHWQKQRKSKQASTLSCAEIPYILY